MGEILVKAESGGGSAAFIGPPSSSANTKLKLPADTGAAGKVLAVKSANHSATNAELEWVTATNTPMFVAGPAVEFTNGTSGSYRKIEFTEVYDPQGTYDASTSKFTPAVAGYYQFNTSVKMGDPSGNDVYNWFLQVGKNGSGVARSEEMMDNSDGDIYQMSTSGIIYLDGDDYLEVYAKAGTYNSANWKCFDTTGHFSAFKLIGA